MPAWEANRALVAPEFGRIADDLTSGRVVPDVTRWREVVSEATRETFRFAGEVVVPKALLPFLHSRDLSQLAEALRRQPSLYFTPLVRRQLDYLARLHWNHREWDRLGWHHLYDRDADDWLPPPQAESAKAAYETLVAAHVEARLPRMALVPRKPPRRRGPCAGIDNPHPTDDPRTKWIDSATLHTWWQVFRSHFEKAAAEDAKVRSVLTRIPTEPPAAFIERAVAVAEGIANIEPPEWSGLVVHDTEPPMPPDLSDAERMTWFLEHADAPPRTTAVLRPIIAAMLTDPYQRGRLERAGRSSYFASAVLAAHLGHRTPERVQNAIDNYRRSAR